MKLKQTITLGIFLLTSVLTQAQVVLNDFSDWTAANPNGGFTNGTWASQVTQNSGFITVGGTADSTGSVYLDAIGTIPKDLSSFGQFSLTARVDGGNASGSFTIVITDTNGEDAASATFLASDFSGTFGTVINSWTVIDSLKLADANGFFIYGSGTADAFRFSFDSLSAIPEPSTYAMLAVGLVGLVVVRRRMAKA